MPCCRILTSGWWNESAVHVAWSDRFFHLPPAWQAEAESFWQIQASRGYFNGKMARLRSWRVQNQQLQIDLETTDYKTLLFSNHHTDRLIADGPEPVLARALGVSAVVQSSDGQLLFMKRSAQVGEYPLCYDLFGGHIDVRLQSIDNSPFRAMELELEEELALPASDYELHCIGLLETRDHCKPELLFAARCQRSAQELVEQAGRAVDSHEYERILTLADTPQAIVTFLQQFNDISPSAFGCLSVYSQLRKRHERQTQTFQG